MVGVRLRFALMCYQHYASHLLTFKLGGSKVRFSETKGSVLIEFAAYRFLQIGLGELAALNQIVRNRLREGP